MMIFEPRMHTNAHEFLTTKHTKHTKNASPPGRQSKKDFVVDHGILNAKAATASGGSAVRIALCAELRLLR